MRMELVAENGFTVPILRGSKKELGRGSELAIHDRTVSRHQIVLELQEPRKKASSVDYNGDFGGLSVKVLGANPVCIVHVRQSPGRKDEGQQMSLLRKGEMDTLYPGDKISLSLSLPMFLTVRHTEGRKDIASSDTEERPGNSGGSFTERETPPNGQDSKQLAEDDLLEKWKDRKVKKVSGPCATHDREHVETSENRRISINDVATTDEEAGIAQAVARRQKRALERRQEHQHDNLTKPVKDSEVVPNIIQTEGSKLEDIVVNTENIDPVKEFGFIVEGSEFEQYKKRSKPEGGRWVWPPAAKDLAGSRIDEEDEDEQAKPTRSNKGKKRAGEDDEEWRGDDPEEEVAIFSAKKPRAGANVNLRSHEASSSKKKDTVGKRLGVGGSVVKGQRKEREAEEEEDDDEADDTLGGFIVNDDDEDDGNGASDEEDEISDDEDIDELDDEDIDEEMDQTQEQDNEIAQHSKRKTKKEKPLCKYGKNCYRKNRDHLAEYRH